MLTYKNPFNFKEPILPGTNFAQIWRRASLEAAVHELSLTSDGVLEGLDILGARRTGKSTFCLQLESYLKEAGYRNVVYIPSICLEANSDLVELVQALGKELTKMGFVLQMKNLESLVDDVSEVEVFKEFVSTVWDGIISEPDSNEGVSPVVIILDGTEILSLAAWSGLVSAWRLLRLNYRRSRTSSSIRVRLVLSGFRDVWDVYRMEHGTPFNPFSRVYLPAFTDEQVLELVDQGFKQSSYEDTNRFAQQMQKRLAGHPWLIQKFCYFTYQEYQDSLAFVDLEEIEKVVATFPDPNLRDAFDFLKKEQSARRLLQRALLSKKTMYDPHGILIQIANWGLIALKESHEFSVNEYYRTRLAEYLRQFQDDGETTESRQGIYEDSGDRILQRRERLSKLGLLKERKTEQEPKMSSSSTVISDLEDCIRDSYKLIGGHWKSIVDSPTPEAKHYSKRMIQSHWENIQDYLSQYLSICQRLDKSIPQDILEISTLFDEYAELERVVESVQPGNTNQLTGDKMVRILFLAANPTGSTRLRLDSESRAIDQALRQSEFRDRFDVRQHWAVRVGDLQGCLLRHKPSIVHFSGHGSRSSEIILEDEFNKSYPVSVTALGGLFSALKDNIRCVVLNACYSEKQARAIAEHIDCVIGMSRAIGDSAAISFAASFYQTLGYGYDIKTAFELGCNQIDLENLSYQDVPKMITLRSDPKEIVLVNDN